MLHCSVCRMDAPETPCPKGLSLHDVAREQEKQQDESESLRPMKCRVSFRAAAARDRATAASSRWQGTGGEKQGSRSGGGAEPPADVEPPPSDGWAHRGPDFWSGLLRREDELRHSDEVQQEYAAAEMSHGSDWLQVRRRVAFAREHRFRPSLRQ